MIFALVAGACSGDKPARQVDRDRSVWGYSGDGIARGVAADGDGNWLITGNFRGTTRIAGRELRSAGRSDAFLAKFDPAGRLLWVKRFGGPRGGDAGIDVDTDTDGNVIVTGQFTGTVDFGDGVVADATGGATDLVVTKFAPSGRPVWTRVVAGDGAEFGDEVATAADGAVVVTGVTASPRLVVQPTGVVAGAHGSTDVLVVVYEPDGRLRWTQRVGGPAEDIGRGMEVDPSGAVLLVGEFTRSITFAGESHPGFGGLDMFVSKWTPEGRLSWAWVAGGPGLESARAVDSDGQGNVYVGGRWQGRFALQGVELVSERGSRDMFLVKLDPAGQRQWIRSIGGARYDEGVELEVNFEGDVYVAGLFSGSATIGGTDATRRSTVGSSHGQTDELIASLDSDGLVRGTTTGGGSGKEVNYAIGLAPGGAVASVGTTEGGARFGSLVLDRKVGWYLATRPTMDSW